MNGNKTFSYILITPESILHPGKTNIISAYPVTRYMTDCFKIYDRRWHKVNQPAARPLVHRILLGEKEVGEATGTSMQRDLNFCTAHKPPQLQGWATTTSHQCVWVQVKSAKDFLLDFSWVYWVWWHFS